MRTASNPAAPPARHLLLLESRALWEMAAFVATYPLLRLGSSGDGHPVLVLPGMGASDLSTGPLRAFLKDRGYGAHGWKLGPNHGPRPGVEQKLQQRLAELAARYGQKVSLVGWSLGGIFAREMARNTPGQVRSVITLGSPFAGVPRASNAWKVYERLSERSVDDWEYRDRMRQPPPVPATAIYSRSDGIVAWQGCMEQEGPQSENIEVEGSHCGLGHNPIVLHAIADRLAQPEGRWRPFDRSGIKHFIYRDPRRDRAGSRTSGPGFAMGSSR